MEFMSIHIQHIFLFFIRRETPSVLLPPSIICLRRHTCLVSIAVPCSIINYHPGLDIVCKNMKTNSFSLILHRFRLHLYSVRYQVISAEYRGHAVKYMVSCLFNIIRHHIFKRKHPFYIHIPGSCDEIPIICILSR